MSHVQRQQAIHGIMLALAPSLRDKFDFSDDGQFTKWADLSYKAAEAFTAKMSPLLVEAAKADGEARVRAVAAAQTSATTPPMELVKDTADALPLTEGAQKMVDEIKHNGEET